MSSAAAKSVTVQLTAGNHRRPACSEGDKIKLGKNMWRMSNQRIKNKMMVHRLLKKEYYPYLKVVSIADGDDSTTLTVKPFNF